MSKRVNFQTRGPYIISFARLAFTAMSRNSTSRHSLGRSSLGPAHEYKVVVLGDRGVGKTSLVLRFIEGVYSDAQQSTVGAFFLTKKLTLEDGQKISMQLWDTAGQVRAVRQRVLSVCSVCY